MVKKCDFTIERESRARTLPYSSRLTPVDAFVVSFG
jgi:hypothetical protein